MDFDLSLLLFWLKKLVSVLLLPPLLPLLPIALGLLLLRRSRRLGLALAWGGLLLALLLVTPGPVNRLLTPLEPPPLELSAIGDAGAIVVLAAGKRQNAPEYGGETINRLSLERLRYGARLARDTGLPLLVTGGAPTGGLAEADLMALSLQQDFGLAPRWVENASRDTRQNAELSAALLRKAGIQKVLLVTHAAHMRRAQEAFESAGLEVVAAPTAWLGQAVENAEDRLHLPSASAAYAGWFALHEWLGLLAYRLSR